MDRGATGEITHHTYPNLVAVEDGLVIANSEADIVVEALRQVVGAARIGSPLPPCEETFPPLGGECVR